MKIIDVAEFYTDQGGGVKTYINQKLRAGARLGVEVVVIAPGKEDAEERRHGGRVLWVKSRPMPFDPRYYFLGDEKRVHALLDAEKPDLVEGSSVWTGGLFVKRWKGNAPKSLIFHQDPVAVYGETFLDQHISRQRVNQLAMPFWSYIRYVAKGYDVTVTSGQWLADKLASFGVRNPQAVPFGIDRAQFSPSNASADRRARMLAACGAPSNARLLLTVSRFHPEKRLDVLLRAFEQVQKEQPLALVIYGQGPTEASLRKLAASIPGVHVAGFTSEPNELAEAYASADALLHGSSAETYGLVVAEALCSGTPLIVPSIGGAADLADASWAERYEPGDVAQCAQAIRRLLGREPARLREAATVGAQRIATMDEHFENLFNLYRTYVR